MKKTPTHTTARRRVLRTSSSVLLAALLSLSGATGAFAQTAGTGTVSGRVLNAATGTYVPNVVVRVPGTNLSATTNNFGEYLLRDVPAGTASLQVEYVGRENITDSVTVTPGGSVQKDFSFDATRRDPNAPIVLNEFRIESDRFKNAAEIAINAERQSINIKNVISTEEFGEIPGGNVGEFIKFLPGVELEYGGTYIAPTDAFGISIRGFGADDTNIMIDGVPVTSASQASLTNQVGLDMLSINNASRVELIKVATPDMPMDSVGGQINLISKSAFEQARPSFSYNAYFVVNSDELNPFKKVVGATDKKVYAGQPGFELSYIKPISSRLGLSLTASRFSQYSANRRLRPEYGIANVNLDMRPFGGANNTPASNSEGPISAANPFLTRVSITDSPRTSVSHSASMKLDWKPFDGLTFAANYQYSTYEASDTDRRIQFRIQRPIDWSDSFVISQAYLTSAQSATGSSYNPSNSLGMDITSRDKEGVTHSAYLRATYQKGPWDITALANRSRSRASFHDFENDHFSGVEVSANVGTMKFEDIRDGIPGRILIYDRTGLELNPFDYTQLSNWSSPTIQGKRGNAESADDNTLFQFDVRRELDFLPWDSVKLAFKTGFRYEESEKIKWGLGTGYRETYVGPALSSADILDDVYTGRSPGWGFAPQQFISTYKLYDIYTQNPANFVQTPDDVRENYYSSLGQNKAMIEENKAWYALIEGRALADRLRFVAGLRDETVTRNGYGPQGDGRWNYVKEENGLLYRNTALLGGVGTVRIDQADSPLFAQNATGTALRADLAARGIAFPTAIVTSNSIEGAKLQRKTTPISGKSEGDPNYSINMSYDVTKKLVAKLAYSIASGRIAIEDATRGLLSGNQNDFRINESEDQFAIPRGTISVANPNLLPESSKNWDFELAYYTEFGGKFSASYYLKNIENFTQTFITLSGTPEFNAIANSLGLDPADYVDWQLTTTENGEGTAKVRGYELTASQDLRSLKFLGDLGRNIRFFASYSHSKRDETNTNRISSRPAASNLATGGVTFSTRRFSLNVKGTWRDYVFNGDKATFRLPDDTTVGIGEFIPSALRVDVSANYQLTNRASIYISARNVLEEGNDKKRYDSLGIYPRYAHMDDYRDTGVQITVGVKGTF